MSKDREIQYILSMKDEASRIHKQFSDAVNKESLSIASAAKGAGAAIGAMFTVGAASEFINKYAEAESQSARLGQALVNVGANSAEVRKQFDDQAESLSKLTATDNDEITALQATLVGMTGNTDAARQLTPAVLDLARGMGISTDAAAKMFAKTNEGSEGLKRAGITIGATNSDLERTERIAAEVEKRWGGMAEAFAKTPAGQLQSTANDLEDIEEMLGKILFDGLKPMLPVIQLLGATAKIIGPIFYGVYAGIAKFVSGIAGLFSIIEGFNNLIGVSSSNAMKNLAVNATHLSSEYIKLAFGVEEATAAQKKNNNEGGNANVIILSMKDKIKALNTELDLLTPGTKAYTDKLVEVTIAQNKYNDAVHVSVAAVAEKLNPSLRTTMQTQGLMLPQINKVTGAFKLQATVIKEEVYSAYEYVQAQIQQVNEDAIAQFASTDQIVNGLVGNMTASMASLFADGENVGGEFAKNVTNMFINMAEAIIGAQMAAALAKGTLTWGVSLAADLALHAAALVALEGARSIASRFHEGGTMGSMGERIPLRSDERPAILKVGETVLPTKPGESIGGGTVINLNFNYAVNGEEFIRQGAESLMRKMGVTDITKVFVNNRSNIAIGTI